VPSVARSKIVVTELELDFQSDMRVEILARDHLATERSPVFYVENSLICSLFGLLCWPAIVPDSWCVLSSLPGGPRGSMDQ
jgi:hypothetical protein